MNLDKFPHNPEWPTQAGAPGRAEPGACAYGVTISSKALKAFMVHASKEEARVNLTQVLVEHHEDRTYLVATDGHRLAWLDLPVFQRDVKRTIPDKEVSHVIPRETLERACKLGDAVTITLGGAVLAWSKAHKITSARTLEATVPYTAAGVTFPPWRQVLPRGFRTEGLPVGYPTTMRVENARTGTGMGTGEGEEILNEVAVAAFNPRYLADACDLGEAWVGKYAVRFAPGTSALDPSVVYAENPDLGNMGVIIMPMRV